jgi:hypothetical protein
MVSLFLAGSATRVTRNKANQLGLPNLCNILNDSVPLCKPWHSHNLGHGVRGKPISPGWTLTPPGGGKAEASSRR